MGDRTRLKGFAPWILVSAVWLFFLDSPAPAQSIKGPVPGVLLVAAEQMSDPHFKHTVVLLIKHDQMGTWGLIINRPTDIAVRDLLTTTEKSAEKLNVYFGGPVHIERLVFLYQDVNDSKSGESDAGLPGLRWSDSQEALEKRFSLGADRIRVYAGYTGWAPGQLAFELARGDWKMIQGRRDNVFSKDPQHLWQGLIDVLGGIAI